MLADWLDAGWASLMNSCLEVFWEEAVSAVFTWVSCLGSKQCGATSEGKVLPMRELCEPPACAQGACSSSHFTLLHAHPATRTYRMLRREMEGSESSGEDYLHACWRRHRCEPGARAAAEVS